MRKLLAGVLAALLLASPTLAVTTQRYSPSATAWTDLGAGPLRLLAPSQPAAYAISDTDPALNAAPNTSVGYGLVGNIPVDVPTTSHVWVRATGSAGGGSTATVVAAPISAAGGGGGTAADQTATAASDGQTPYTTNQHANTYGYQFNGTGWDRERGLNGTRYVLTPDIQGSSTLDATSTSSKVDIPLNGTSTVGLTFTGVVGGAAVSFSTSNDGGTTFSAKGTVNCANPAAATSTYSMNGQPRVDVAGARVLRVQVSTVGTGTIGVAYNLSSAPLACPNLGASNLLQLNGVQLGSPSPYGTPPAGGSVVPNFNGFITNFPGTQVVSWSGQAVNQGAAAASNGAWPTYPVPQTYALLSNASATGPTATTVGGSYLFDLKGTLGGATVSLNATVNGVTTTLKSYTAATTTPDVYTVASGTTLQAVVTGGSPSGLNATLGGIGSPPSVALTNNPGAAGDATITAGGTAQNLFSGATPANGYEVENVEDGEDCWVSDHGTAVANGSGSHRVGLGSGTYRTPVGYKPVQAVSVVCATTNHKLTASRW